jgi:hypothetical protein
MAKRKTKAKRYAVQRHINISGLQEAGGGTAPNCNIVDVGRFLSETNHRLYRQSRVYKAKINAIEPPNAGRAVSVYVLRDTWMLQKAYQMAKDAFDKNMSEERDSISPVNEARWQDFRVDLDPTSAITATVLSPTAVNNANFNGGTSLSNGEFVNSFTYDESGNAKAFGLYTAGSRWSIMQEYDNTADVDSSPANEVSGSNINAYGGLDNDNQQAARAHLQAGGNAPPYDPNSLGAGHMFRKVATLGGTSDGNAKMTTGFFDAPLGAIYIVSEGWNQDLELEVAAGDYKGVVGAEYIDVTKKFGHRRA